VDQAQKEFDRVLEIYPDHPDALLEKARIFQYEDDRAAAIDYCTRAIHATHGYATAHLQRARLWLDQYEELRQASGRYVRLETEEGRTLAEKIRSDLREVQAWSKDARELTFANGALAFVEGEHEKAARQLEDYSKLTLSDYRGWIWTAHAWLHVPGMEARATNSLNEAIKYRPKLASLLVYRGIAQLQESRRLRRGSDAEKAIRLRSLAMDDFRAARDLDPSDPGAHCGLGDACLEAGEGSLAAAHFTQALSMSPRYSAALIGRARARLREGDAARALADAEEALRVGSVDPRAYVVRGRARCSHEDLGGALSDLSRALELDPREPEALVGLGDLKRERGDAGGAIEDYGRALAIDPASGEAFHHRANARRDLGQAEAAVADLDRALKFDSGNPWIHYDRAVCSCDRGDWLEALSDLRKGLARMPLDPFPFWMAIWVARSRSGESGAAGEELAMLAGEVLAAEPQKLPSKVVRMALGQIGVRAFMEELDRVPRRRDETARGYFYAAERALADGDRSSARDLFGRCLKAKAVTAPEDSMAAAEVRALEGKR
jgi:tetratricopeptide (TPR) repeat protein